MGWSGGRNVGWDTRYPDSRPRLSADCKIVTLDRGACSGLFEMPIPPSVRCVGVVELTARATACRPRCMYAVVVRMAGTPWDTGTDLTTAGQYGVWASSQGGFACFSNGELVADSPCHGHAMAGAIISCTVTRSRAIFRVDSEEAWVCDLPAADVSSIGV